MTKASVIYRGPSKIDDSPIVAIYLPGSTNGKTGNMAQTYILADNGKTPMENSRTGGDFGICGACPHKGETNNNPSGVASKRSCYVTLHHGPLQVYKALMRGKYPDAITSEARQRLGAGANIRLGTYGDPLAVPDNIWRELLTHSKGHTGYTHQSGLLPDSDVSMVMLSADTPEQASTAHMQGKRTFRVIPVAEWKEKGKASLLQNEILCPASNEAGNKTDCNSCGLCSGQNIRAKSIAIPAHGVGKKHVS